MASSPMSSTCKRRQAARWTTISSSRCAPQTRRAAEDALIAEAVSAFEARAEVVRKALKAKGYGVRELNIGAGGGGPRPLQYEMAAARAAPVAVEAGVSQVSVTVNGSIQ